MGTAREASSEIPRLRNLGRASAGWLAAIGITRRGQVETIGPVEIYLRLKSLRYNVSPNTSCGRSRERCSTSPGTRSRRR